MATNIVIESRRVAGLRHPPRVSAARAIALVFFVNGLMVGSWAARIPALRDGLGIGDGELGIALAFVAAGALATMPLSGALVARLGSRPPTRVFIALMCVAPVLPFLVPSFALLLAAAFALGAANGGVDVAMNAQGATVEKRAGRLLFGRLHAAFSAGGLAGAATGALAAGLGIDARANLAIAGALCAAVTLPATRGLLADDAVERAAPAFARPTRPLLALGVLAFCCLLAEGAALDWSAVYVRDDLGGADALAALAYAAFSATMLAGRLLSDRLVEGRRPSALLRAGGTVAGGGLALALLLDAPAAALAGFALLGGGLALTIPLVFRAAAGSGTSGAGPSLAAVSTMGYTGFLAGPPLIGAIAEASSLSVGLAFVAFMAAAAAVLAPAVEPRAPAGAAAHAVT
jgi:MFS family permease